MSTNIIPLTFYIESFFLDNIVLQFSPSLPPPPLSLSIALSLSLSLYIYIYIYNFFFLCLMVYKHEWVIWWHSHAGRWTVVVIFTPWLVGWEGLFISKKYRSKSKRNSVTGDLKYLQWRSSRHVSQKPTEKFLVEGDLVLQWKAITKITVYDYTTITQ